MNGTFGITYEQLQPKLFLSAGPSATKHGPNSIFFIYANDEDLLFMAFIVIHDHHLRFVIPERE
jgi:hypothetical protein